MTGKIKRIDNILTGQGVTREPTRKVRTRGIPTPVQKNWAKNWATPRYRAPASQVLAQERSAKAWLKFMLGDYAEDVLPKYHCLTCGAEDIGDRPDCPEDGVHCNIVEKE